MTPLKKRTSHPGAGAGAGTAGRSAAIAVAAGILAALMLHLFSFSELYSNVRYAATDFKWRRFHTQALADPDIVIVAIDEFSIKKMSDVLNMNWPWPRQFYGLVLDYFKKAGAGPVAFDILFNESEVGRMDIDGDRSEADFADAMAKSGSVILSMMLGDENAPQAATGPPQGSVTFQNAEKLPVKQYNSMTLPLKVLRESAGGLGVVTFHMDPDGICRRVPLVLKAGGACFPHLAFAAYLDAAEDAVVAYDEGTGRLITRKANFRLDRNGNYPLYWYGPGGGGESPGGGVKNSTYRYDSFYDVLRSAVQLRDGINPVIPLDAYTDKKIVICASAAGLADLKPTPFSSKGPYIGGEIHATLLDNLLNQRSIREVPAAWVTLLTLLLLIPISYAFIRQSLFFSLSLAASSAFLFIAADVYLFKFSAVDMDLVFPVLGIVLVSAGSAMFKMLTEGRAKQQIKTIFSRYLHEDVIQILMQDPDRVDLEGSEMVGTVLFTDLQGFTSFAEDKTPRELIMVLNRYFQVVTNIVLDHGGMLDKYTGDGIMAVFGAPLAREDHARAACEVVLAFRDRNINTLIPTPEGNIVTRIGISSGPIVVGNLGSDRKMDFTAIGDTVNLSARLEGVNKSYGTTNIMSEYARDPVREDYIFRELDVIRVKGKQEPIRIFTLVGRKGEVTESRMRIENEFRRAVDIYRQRRWEAAIKQFEHVLQLSPADAPSNALIDRCRLLTAHPGLVDEFGVFTFNTK